MYGHLSNESRIGKDRRDFFADITNAKGAQAVPLQAKKQVSAAEPATALLIDDDVEGTLRRLARWIHQSDLGRVHIEWFATADRVVVVQCDAEKDIPLVEPMAAWSTLQRVDIPALNCFERVNGENSSDLRKTRAIGVFAGMGLATTPMYLLRDTTLLDSIAAGNASTVLVADLRTLLSQPLVIRIDILKACQESWQNLPCKFPVFTCEEALAWLQEALATRADVPRQHLAVVVHHFIPARASAWSECNLGTKRVRIDTTWGLPDGLQAFPCDTIYVGHEIDTYPRYKDQFLDVDSEAKTVTRAAAPALALAEVITDDDAHNIAHETRRVAEKLGKSVRVMWFLETDGGAAITSIFPWIYDDDGASADPYLCGGTDVPRVGLVGTAGRARRLAVGGVRRIESPADLAEFEKDHVRFNLGDNRVVFRPTTEQDIRSKEFVRQVAHVVKNARWKIVLEGSSLTHNYYLLRDAGVDVESAAEYFSRPRRRQIFDKIVRDRVPDSIRAKGEQINVRPMHGEELKRELLRKLVEEALEATTAGTDAAMLEELADTYEVVLALLPLVSADREKLEAVAEKKRAKRGGFEKGLFLLSTGGDSEEDRPRTRHRYVRIEQDEGAVHMLLPLVPADPERREELAVVSIGDTRLQIKTAYAGDDVTVSVAVLRPSRQPQSAQLSLDLGDDH